MIFVAFSVKKKRITCTYSGPFLPPNHLYTQLI